MDIFAYHELAGGVYTRKHPLRKELPQFPGDWLFPLSEIELEGVVTRAPHRPTKILAMRYGSNFATPDHICIDGKWGRRTERRSER